MTQIALWGEDEDGPEKEPVQSEKAVGWRTFVKNNYRLVYRWPAAAPVKSEITLCPWHAAPVGPVTRMCAICRQEAWAEMARKYLAESSGRRYVPSTPGPSSEPPDRTGSRGGTTGSLEEGLERLEEHRRRDAILLRPAIIKQCQLYGECHADHVAYVPVEQRNSVGANFLALDNLGFITKKIPLDHRPSKLKAAHSRKSYVYVLTAKGRALPPYS